MIYDSVDNIPAKIYFKILDTGDLSILTDDKKISQVELELIWSNILDQVDKISTNEKGKKITSIYASISEISCKHQAVLCSIKALRTKHLNKDEELVQILENYGYKFLYKNSPEENIEEQYLKDLQKIERENKSEILRIERLKAQLPEEKEQKEENQPIDEIIIGYSAIVGVGFVDTNSVTYSQLIALINIGNQKIKSAENA